MKTRFILASIALAMCMAAMSSAEWIVGAGKSDITGPAYGLGMMGYAMPQQYTKGIHTRLWARAFIFANADKRVVFVSSDLCFTTQAVKQTVVEKLKKIYGPTLYTEENVMLSATHTHAGPGGYSWHPLYDISTFGFHDQNFNVIVDGIVSAIQQANRTASAGQLSYTTGRLEKSNANRSPSAYLGNPAEERAQYDANTDKEFTVMALKQFSDMSTFNAGMIGWFAVHGTSMNNTNMYISGDNKGHGSALLEAWGNSQPRPSSAGPFVGAVAQSNEGDVSPNTRGAFCDNGMPCEVAHSTCGGWSEGCHAYGPGQTDFDSTRIIGENQFNALAHSLPNIPVQGEIKYMHVWVNMEATTVSAEYTGTGKTASTCIGALGDSFAAGTTDGPGEFNFVQGTNDSSTNWYWNWLTSKILAAPTAEDLACHAPKPILFMTGRIMFPGKWTQGIIPLQVFQLGNFWIVGVPGEFSTMAGRRLRNQVKQSIMRAGGWTSDSHLVIAGLTNSYTHYITTREEYAYQRYEGASTMFGPFTLNAYEMYYSDLAARLVKGLPAPPSEKPENISSAIFYLQPAVSPDQVPAGASFGSVVQDVLPSYTQGQTVQVKFWGGNPRNNLHTGWTFLDVMKQQSDGSWSSVANDNDWSTKFWFEYVTGGGQVRIQWDIPANALAGTYKIVHYGDYKTQSNSIVSYTGTSSTFHVI
jgi:neutral ceramidase